MRLRNIVLFSTIPLIFLVAVTGYVGFISAQRTNSQFSSIVSTSLPGVRALFEINDASVRIKVIANNSILEPAESAQFEGSNAARRKSELFASINDLERWTDEYINVLSEQAGEQRRIVALLDKTKANTVEQALELFLLKERQADAKTIASQVQTLDAATVALERVISEAVAGELETIKNKNLDVAMNTNLTLTFGVGFACVVVGLLFFIGLSITNVVTKRMGMLRQAAQEVAKGDLSKRVAFEGSGELGMLANTFNSMTAQLEELDQLKSKNALELQARLEELESTKKAMSVLLEDVSQKKEEVEKKKVESDAVLSSIGEGMIATDISGLIRLANPAAAVLCDLPVDGPQQKNVYTLIPLLSSADIPVSRDKHPLRRALASKQKVEEVLGMHRQNGEKLQVHITATPVIENGLTTGGIMIIRDITQEAHIDTMKSEFIALASHQLRTPLSAIRWFAELLLNGDAGKLTPEQQDFAKSIYESTQRMIELVGALLTISRIESGRINLDPHPTHLNAVLDGVIKELSAKIEQKQHQLAVSIHPDLGEIFIDPGLIRQVYINLLSNAIKYTPKGGEIAVFVSRKGEEIISQVTDSGYGIPLPDQKHVFEKFFRAENVAKVETDGTGLGLYLIKAIIESSGGTISFRSEEGKGTTFWFSLPITGMQVKDGLPLPKE